MIYQVAASNSDFTISHITFVLVDYGDWYLRQFNHVRLYLCLLESGA